MSESSKLVWRNLATNCNLHVHNGQVKEYFTKIPIYFSLYFLNTHHSAKRTQVFIEESSFSKFANAEETLGRGWNGYFVWSFPHLECARAKMTFTTPIKQSLGKILFFKKFASSAYYGVFHCNLKRKLPVHSDGCWRVFVPFTKTYFQIYFLFWFWVKHYATFRFAGWTKTETCFASVTLNKSRKWHTVDGLLFLQKELEPTSH